MTSKKQVIEAYPCFYTSLYNDDFWSNTYYFLHFFTIQIHFAYILSHITLVLSTIRIYYFLYI